MSSERFLEYFTNSFFNIKCVCCLLFSMLIVEKQLPHNIMECEDITSRILCFWREYVLMFGSYDNNCEVGVISWLFYELRMLPSLLDMQCWNENSAWYNGKCGYVSIFGSYLDHATQFTNSWFLKNISRYVVTSVDCRNPKSLEYYLSMLLGEIWKSDTLESYPYNKTPKLASLSYTRSPSFSVHYGLY